MFVLFFLTKLTQHVFRAGTTTRSSSTSTIMEMSSRGAKLTRIPSPGVSTLSVCPTVANKSSTTRRTRTATGLKSHTSRPAAVSTATQRIITARLNTDRPSSVDRNVTRIFPLVQLTLFPPERRILDCCQLSPLLVFMITCCNPLMSQ